MGFYLTIILLLFSAVLSAKTLYMPWMGSIREGQRMVYSQFIKEFGKDSFDEVIRYTEAEEIGQIIRAAKPNDMIITTGHAYILPEIVSNSKLLYLAREKIFSGVKFVHDLEYQNLFEQHSLIDSDLKNAGKIGATIVTYREDIRSYATRFLQRERLHGSVVKLPNLEGLLIGSVPEVYQSKFDEAMAFIKFNHNRRVVLFSDQSIEKHFLNDTIGFLKQLYRRAPNTAVMIALHPHSFIMLESRMSRAMNEDFFMALDKFKNHYIFKSKIDLPTASLIPYVDLVVSDSSTVAAVAKESGFATLMATDTAITGVNMWKAPLEKLEALPKPTVESRAANRERAKSLYASVKKEWGALSQKDSVRCSSLLELIIMRDSGY